MTKKDEWQERAARLFCAALAVLAAYLAIRYGGAVLVVFGGALAVAALVYPLSVRTARLTHLPQRLCAVLYVLLLLAALGGLAAFVLVRLGEEIADLVSQVKGLKAVILKTYGAGNAPQRPWLVSRLKRMTEKGMIVVNITQCSKGRVEMGLYETSLQLLEAGVLNGYDATPESMITKLMFLLGHGFTREEIVEKMNQSLRGEISTD